MGTSPKSAYETQEDLNPDPCAIMEPDDFSGIKYGGQYDLASLWDTHMKFKDGVHSKKQKKEVDLG